MAFSKSPHFHSYFSVGGNRELLKYFVTVQLEKTGCSLSTKEKEEENIKKKVQYKNKQHDDLRHELLFHNKWGRKIFKNAKHDAKLLIKTSHLDISFIFMKGKSSHAPHFFYSCSFVPHTTLPLMSNIKNSFNFIRC